MDGIKFQFDGYDDLRTVFKNLEDVIDSEEIKQGTRAAAKYLMSRGKSRLKSRLKSKSSNLAHSFTYKMKKKNGGVLVGFKRPQGSAAHLVDKGTKRRTTSSGANRGRIKANNFWTDTRTNDTDTAMQIMMDAVQSSINKILLR